jgi:hypothetical protein
MSLILKGRNMPSLLIIGGVLAALAIITPFIRPARTQDRVDNQKSSGRLIEGTYVGDIPVRVKRYNQEALRVYNDPKFNSLEEIDSYVNKRKEQLQYLVGAHGDQEIEVTLSPARKLNLEEFLTLATKHGLAVSELSLDIFVDGKWDRMVWFDKTAPLVDLSKDSKTIIEKILETESATPGINKEEGAEELPAERTTVAVRYGRGKMNGPSALKLQKNAAILLVDPVTDIAESFKGQANEIVVAQMPQLYVYKAGKFGDFYDTRNRTQRNQKTGSDLRQ